MMAQNLSGEAILFGMLLSILIKSNPLLVTLAPSIRVMMIYGIDLFPMQQMK
ncbi:hypothetical protein DSECCO2_622600 [anaerobic digester metagenome]